MMPSPVKSYIGVFITVKDVAGDAIENANVVVDGVSGTPVCSVLTSSTGVHHNTYEVSVRETQYKVTVSKAGFNTVSQLITVTWGQGGANTDWYGKFTGGFDAFEVDPVLPGELNVTLSEMLP